MASVLSHPAAALGLGPWFGPAALGRRVVVVGVVCSILPDIDAIGFWLGVPYGSPLGHRGLTHSIVFSAALAALVVGAGFRLHPARGALFGFLFLSGASHGFFDAMTDGGRGIALFWPLTDRRFFLPWRPIRVAPIGVTGLSGARAVAIFKTELLWVWLPCLILWSCGRLVKDSARGRG